MTDDIYAALSWFANYTNFYSVLSVILCCIIMVVFILRLNGENFVSSSATHYVTVGEQSMTQIYNPFAVQLDKSNCSSLKDGIYVRFSMMETSKVKVLWGVDIQTFKKEIQKTSRELVERFDSDSFFDGKYKTSESVGLFSVEDGERNMYLKCPGEITEESLGEPPRVVYPVVIVSSLTNADISLDLTKIVVQFTVIHLKDSFCSLDSHIVYQFVKTNFNNIISLQPIFMSTGESNSNSDISSNVSNQTSDQTDTNSCNASNSQCQNLQGLSLNGSFTPSKSCGKVQKCSEDERKTCENELCSCELSEVDHGLNGLKADCDTELNHNENLSDEENSASPVGNHFEDSKDKIQNDTIDQDDSEACCVCQSLPVFFTVLPCRHACVCYRCISHLDKCPICRSLIESYFRISGSRTSEEVHSSDDETENIGLNRWQAFNQRLNEMLGFI